MTLNSLLVFRKSYLIGFPYVPVWQQVCAQMNDSPCLCRPPCSDTGWGCSHLCWYDRWRRCIPRDSHTCSPRPGQSTWQHTPHTPPITTIHASQVTRRMIGYKCVTWNNLVCPFPKSLIKLLMRYLLQNISLSKYSPQCSKVYATCNRSMHCVASLHSIL